MKLPNYKSDWNDMFVREKVRQDESRLADYPRPLKTIKEKSRNFITNPAVLRAFARNFYRGLLP